ncbi:SDR family NAD(P)-dependent oxidoreductase [Sphingomonas ginsenosidivorax]|uniref:SDR family NAD(P)-dependent oxidoreductase n=1 Tax=Sphingomonas ginsenosidivorax TaxID=862135 RepID=A0A5C6UCB5_9SPHN|nr:SDR family NAD(P)-dependent oxidoreductase [Sphingomonas ginsenosidivorax]TXC70294.1 SDR family NAD(P)-dependent oxidoreductase [Sphingomonas ginsenosidivorax]
MPDLRFDDRVVVITGGGRGLGRAYAELLSGAGARVVVNDLGVSMAGDGTAEDPAGDTVAAIVAAGGQAVANRDTVATSAGGKAIIDQALDTYGRIDVLIHNAGNVRRAPLAEMSEEIFRSVLDVHLIGGFNVLQPAFAAMCKAGYGRIVMTTSIGGLYGNYEVANYSAAKAGLIGLSHVAAIEGAPHNVMSNCIAPSAVTRMSEGVDTSQFPPLGPEFVTPAVGWLAHESCSVSGEVIAALGGRIAKAYLAETKGVWRPGWTMAEVGAQMAVIDDRQDAMTFPVVPTEAGGPHGFMKHLGASFAMARANG